MPHPTLTTPRLILRPWRDDDLIPYAKMCADPRVMEFFPATLTRAQCEAGVARIRDHFDRHGFGMWAVEVRNQAPFIGFVGLAHVPFDAPFTPAVETGWRLAAEQWGRGYATEAAHAALAFGFEQLNLDQIVAFAVPANVRSTRVMQRLGMTHDPAEDFDHPRIPEDSPLRRHALYRITKAEGRRM